MIENQTRPERPNARLSPKRGCKNREKPSLKEQEMEKISGLFRRSHVWFAAAASGEHENR
jgi:hypothetical protein